MAKLSPISRGEANAAIAACRATPGSYILETGSWRACCVGDSPGKVVCIVCTRDEQRCSRYEEFSGIQELFGFMQLSPALELVALDE